MALNPLTVANSTFFLVTHAQTVFRARIYYWCIWDTVCLRVCIVVNSFKTFSWNICRYFAVIKPMSLVGVDRRGKLMLCVAWIGSCICSMPQAIIFHVETHPNVTHYQQCVTYNFFKNEFQEVLYSFMGMLFMYALPLVIIIYCYASIYIELYKKSKKCVTGECETAAVVPNWNLIWTRNLSALLRSFSALKWWRIGPCQAKNTAYDHNNCDCVYCVMDTVLCDVCLVSFDIFSMGYRKEIRIR